MRDLLRLHSAPGSFCRRSVPRAKARGRGQTRPSRSRTIERASQARRSPAQRSGSDSVRKTWPNRFPRARADRRAARASARKTPVPGAQFVTICNDRDRAMPGRTHGSGLSQVALCAGSDNNQAAVNRGFRKWLERLRPLAIAVVWMSARRRTVDSMKFGDALDERMRKRAPPTCRPIP